MISPRQVLEDTMRPADLLLRVYRLLEHDVAQFDGDMIGALRELVGALPDEGLMLIYNELFLGLVRERAQIPPTALKRSALCNLLRQAVVASCTALDTYLPSLLQTNLPTVIQAKGREFLPEDQSVREFFADLTFDLTETLRLLSDPDAPLYISNKILSLAKFKYLSSRKGVHVVGALLTIPKTWDEIAGKLQRDKKDLMNIIDETTRRRNDIVHRGDRPQTQPDGPVQEISYAWARQSVDTIAHVCFALDELVVARMAQLRHPDAV